MSFGVKTVSETRLCDFGFSMNHSDCSGRFIRLFALCFKYINNYAQIAITRSNEKLDVSYMTMISFVHAERKH